jgi:predicted permease
VVTDLIHRLRALVARRTVEREIDEELQFHIERQAEVYQRAGIDRVEAVRRARVDFGGLEQIKEEYRDALGVRLLDELRWDVRLATRALFATPIVTSVAILSLALVIGANTGIYSILNGLILRNLPVHEPLRLVHVTDSIVTEGTTRVRAWSYPAWDQIRQRTHLFEAATAWSFVRFNLASGGESRPIDGMWADGSFFDALGVRAIIGRTFGAQDDQSDGGPNGPVAVISYGYWQREFGGAAAAIGRTIRLTGVPFTIIGVTPPEFFGLEVGRTFDVIVPVRTEALIRGRESVLDSAATNFLSIVARLRHDQSSESAAAALRHVQAEVRAATVAQWEKDTVDRYLTSPFTVVPAATGYSSLRQRYEAPLITIAIIVGLVLLVGCVNVANLLLARAIGRRHELSVRVALGATRWRISRQLLTESVILSAAGAALGLVIAAFIGPFLVRQLSTPTNLVFLDVSIEWRVLGFTFVVAAATSLLFGTAPAWRASHVPPIEAVKEQGRLVTESTQHGVMGWLVVVQVALSVLLVVAAGLFIRSFVSVTNRPLGFEPDRLLVVVMDAQRTTVTPFARRALYDRAREAVRGLPGVAEAAVSFLSPLGGGGFTPAVQIEEGSGAAQPTDREVFGNLVTASWFRTYGTPVKIGRSFSEEDRHGAPRVVIVNETFARELLSGDPIGRVITIYANTPRALSARVVGVSTDAIHSSPRERVPPTWYLPIAQFDVLEFPFPTARLSVQTSTEAPEALTRTIAAAIADVDPQLALTIRPLGSQLRGSMTQDRLMAQLAGFLGALALVLAMLGLYGVTSYAITQRRTEIAIRLALGAAATRVTIQILTRVALLVGIGVGAGTAFSFWASRFLDGLIYDLAPRDPATFAGAVLLLCGLAAVAAWLPVRRAARMDPVAILRES